MLAQHAPRYKLVQEFATLGRYVKKLWVLRSYGLPYGRRSRNNEARMTGTPKRWVVRKGAAYPRRVFMVFTIAAAVSVFQVIITEFFRSCRRGLADSYARHASHAGV